MNLTWHIIKKDLRALKWPLLLWALVVATKMGIGVVLLTADGTEGPEWFSRLALFSKLLAGLEGCVFVLVAALINEDLLVGTTAYWMTRPISGARLLRAKLFNIGLVFWVVPVLISLPWWQGCGYGLREIAWAAVELAAIQTIFVLVGLLWAVITDGYARFLMWTLVMVVAIPSIGGLIGMHLSKVNAVVMPGVATSRICVAIALAVAGIAAVVVHQFLTRRLWRSIAMIGTTVGLIIMTGLWWPRDLKIAAKWQAYGERQAEASWPAATAPAGLTFALTGAELLRPAPGTRAGRPVWLRANYRVEGLPESHALQSFVSNYSLRWPDGVSEAGWSWIKPDKRISRLVEMKALGQSFASGEAAAVDEAQASQTIPAAAAARLHTGPVAYTLTVRYGLMEVESATAVPLQAGSRTLNGFLGERIAHVEKEGDQLLVTFVRHNPALAFDWLLGGQNYVLGVGQAMARQFSQYLLVNKARDFADRGTTLWATTTRIGTVEIAWQTITYRASKDPASRRPSLEAINAVSEAELVRVTLREQARFAHEFKTDALSVQFDKP